MILRPHRAKIDEGIAIELVPLTGDKVDTRLAKAIVTAVLYNIMYSELPYAKDGMPTSETAEIIRFNRRLKEIIDEAI